MQTVMLMRCILVLPNPSMEMGSKEARQVPISLEKADNTVVMKNSWKGKIVSLLTAMPLSE
jgi:hypothetical protein